MLKTLPGLLFLGMLLLGCEPISKTSSDINKVLEIHQNLEAKPLDSTQYYLKKAQALLTKIKDAPDSIHAENNYLLGQYFKEKGVMDSAMIYFDNATDYVKDSLRSKRQTDYFQQAWNTYAGMGRFGDCFSVSEKFHTLLDPDKNYSSYSWYYYWEKSAHLMKGDFEKAQEIVTHQIEFTREKDTSNLPYALLSLADLKNRYLKDRPGAFVILNDLLSNYQLTYNFKEQAHTKSGIYNYFDKNYNKALSHYLLALEAGKKNTESDDYLNDLANNYSNIAEVYIDLKQHNMARIYLDSARGIGIANMARSRQKNLFNYELRLAMETDKGNKELTKLMDQINTHQDDVYKDKFDNELAALRKANENEKLLLQAKQATDIENLKLETRSLILFISILLLAVIGALFYQRRKLRFEKQSLQNQQRLLRSQMNPHFTFNTLYAIQNEIKKDQKGATDYLMKFSRLLRLTLENSTQNYVQLEKELEAIKKYIELQLVGFPSKFSYQIHLDGLEEDDFIFIPPMLLQPFVENSIQHGFHGIKYPGEISIRLTLQPKFIQCQIEDNGQGIVGSTSKLKNSMSVNLISDFLAKATKSEVEILNKSDINPEKSGVIINLLIPFRLTEDD